MSQPWANMKKDDNGDNEININNNNNGNVGNNELVNHHYCTLNLMDSTNRIILSGDLLEVNCVVFFSFHRILLTFSYNYSAAMILGPLKVFVPPIPSPRVVMLMK